MPVSNPLYGMIRWLKWNLMTEQFFRVWYIRLKSNVSFPFFQTTRRDHTIDGLLNMMPKRGMDKFLVPVVGGVPTCLEDSIEHHNGKTFVVVPQSDVLDLWFKDDLPPAQSLRLYDVIQASTTEGT